MIEVFKIEANVWKERFSEHAHLAVFQEEKRGELDRIDFAVLALKDDVPMGYITCREIDKESVYWQYGGIVPSQRGTIQSYRVHEALIDYCKKHYKRVLAYVENTNLPMLKMKQKLGFLIIGTRNYKGSVLLEHLLEFDNGK